MSRECHRWSGSVPGRGRTGFIPHSPAFMFGLLVLSLLLLPPAGFSAPGRAVGSIRGVVLDRATRRPIAAANVVVVGSKRGAATDIDGAFMVPGLPPGTYHVTASALGYETQTISELAVMPGRAREVEFLLRPTVIQAEEVIARAPLFATVSPDLPTSSRSLSYEEVRRAPGGIEDVQRTVQALPGVVNQDDSNNEIVVRGGSPLENLTVIDGIEVDNTNHFTFGGESEGNGGSINALNTEFLRDVTFASGGFSARYGDRLSSVLDLNLREGRRDRFGGAVDFGMAGMGGYLEGPMPGRQGSYLASVRKSYLDLLPKSAVGLTAIPHYWNTQGKLTWDLNATQLLTLNGLYSEDSHSIKPEDEKEGFSTGLDALEFNTTRYFYGARLRSLWGKGYTDLVAARVLGRVHWNIYETVEENGRRVERLTVENDRTEITDQVHLFWTGQAAGSDEWSAGVSLKPITYEHRLFVDGDSIAFDDGYLDRDEFGQPLYDGQPDTFRFEDRREEVSRKGLKYAGFIQYTWRPSRCLSVTAGLRYDGFDTSGRDAIGPRFSLQWEFRPNWTIKLATGTYYQSQNYSVYMDETAGSANRHLPYSRANQVVAGLSFLPRLSTMLSLEGYFKKYDHLLVREEDIVRETTGDRTFDSDVFLAEGKKEAWGIEFFAQQKMMTNWYGTFSYSFGEARASDPAFGTYPATYDLRHVITTTLGYKTSFITNSTYRNLIRKPWFFWVYALPINGDAVTLSTRYRYITGRPYTRKVWYAEGWDSPEPIFEGHWEEQGHNNGRYPDYRRWDLRIDDKHYFGESALVYYVEAQNLLDHGNIAQYYYGDDGERKTIFQFRRLFVVGIRYEF
ncbi:MAG TPA: TonB-dependent receptor [Bacteroidetes bacterium]|nr:TonB-dependent receptor [Bacteroidota bacterium]